TASNTLQGHISQLRRILGDRHSIVARAPGYVLDHGWEPTDLQLAERLIQQGRQAAEPVEGARQLARALGFWRGPAIVDVACSTWLEEQAERLERLRRSGLEALVEARLKLGEHAALIPELEQLCREHPYHELIQGQLMLALYRSGRQ